MNPTILWFRRDLRLHDNPALKWACENSTSIIPVYIHSPVEEKPWSPGGASRWWLYNSLTELDKQLQAYGLKLQYLKGPSYTALSNIIQNTGANTLVYNNIYEPHIHKRDHDISRSLENDIQVRNFDSGLFFRPGTVLNNSQSPYKVFTAFYKKIRPLLDHDYEYDYYSLEILKKKLNILTSHQVDSAVPLGSLGLLDSNNWHDKLHNYWSPGENRALQLADNFLDDAVQEYQTHRDIPSIDGTSRLSPHLHYGEITPKQLYISMQPLLEGACGAKSIQSAEVFLKQLIWREFANHVLWHFPHTMTRPMDVRYKQSFWRNNKKQFEAWTKGQTGIPIIDAGMKQLWETGWMHNRVRMVVSSFLTKNLGISWTHGAQWFWDTLVDADLANNNMGWQWVAGCGVDAAPYYRIFNPITQEKRFDPEASYIRAWSDNETEHRSPIVDLADTRKQALERYKQHINAQE